MKMEIAWSYLPGFNWKPLGEQVVHFARAQIANGGSI